MQFQKCDGDTVRALKREITKSLCLEHFDPICLQQLNKADYPLENNQNAPRILDAPSPRTQGNKADGKQFADYLVNPNRLKSSEDTVNNVTRDWLNSGEMPGAFWDQSTYTSNANFWNICKTIGSYIPYVSTLVSAVSDAVDMFSVERAEHRDSACRQYPETIAATAGVSTDCMPNYNIQTGEVRFFLGLTKEQQLAKLKDPQICNYYNKLLGKAYVVNKALEASYINNVSAYPTCSNPIAFEMDSSLPSDPKVHLPVESTLSASPPSIKMKGNYTNPQGMEDYVLQFNKGGMSTTAHGVRTFSSGNIYDPSVIAYPPNHLDYAPPAERVDLHHEYHSAQGDLRSATIISSIAGACCIQTDQKGCFDRHLRIGGGNVNSQSVNNSRRAQ